MKKLLSLSLAFTALIFSATAQERREMKEKKQGYGQHDKSRKDKKEYIKNVNLTEAQRTQLKADRDAYKQKISQLKSQNLTDAQYQEQVKILHAEQRAKMQALLTPEQKNQMAQMKSSEANRENFEGKRNGKNKGDFKEKIALTDDQASRLKAQKDAMKVKKEAIKNDPSLSQEQKKERMKALKLEAQKQRNSILTPDQVKIMREMKRDHKNNNSRKARK